ncbi:EAL domain-containing protein [Niallia sp. JL1B1071]|uniref:EAL domain-containing protein n=1 Tax=Niallia tiangongensis TaxID=3237105 RepID=UPI0037DDB069
MDKRDISNFTNYYYHLYQPIFCVHNWSLFGYEILLRHPNFSSASTLFKWAKKEKKSIDIDFLSIEKAIRMMVMKPKQSSLIFINVYPRTLLDARWPIFIKNLVKNLNLDTDKIVFELNEEYSYLGTNEMCKLKMTIKHLRQLKFKVALDDVGRNPTSLQKIDFLDSDFIKLDKSLSKNLANSSEKQYVVESVIKFKKDKKIILEGVEEPTDLAMAKLIGIDMVQGYLLGKPDMHRYDILKIEDFFKREQF